MHADGLQAQDDAPTSLLRGFLVPGLAARPCERGDEEEGGGVGERKGGGGEEEGGGERGGKGEE